MTPPMKANNYRQHITYIQASYYPYMASICTNNYGSRINENRFTLLTFVVHTS